MMKTGFDATLKELTNDPNFNKYLPFALSALKASGVLRALRELARPAAVPVTGLENALAQQAFEAQKSIGYNNCLDDLIYFVDRYLKDKTQTNAPELNYGAGLAVLESGDLTKEELDAIISGAEPDTIYTKLYAEHTRAAAGAGSEQGVSKP